MIATETNDAKWISNEFSREKSHALRNKCDAIIIGKNTLLLDNPSLDVRIPNKYSDPQKIVIIPKLDVSLKKIIEMKAYKLSTEKPLIIVCNNNSNNTLKATKFINSGIEIIMLNKKENSLDLDELLIKLGKKEITSLLLEGGSGVYNSFLKQNLVDKLYLFLALLVIGKNGIHWAGNFNIKKLSSALRFEFDSVQQLDGNIQIVCYPIRKEN